MQPKNNYFAMKVKLNKEQIEAIIRDPVKAEAAGVKVSDPWWVIVLKVVAYAIGLLLGGTLTVGCANVVGII